MTVSITSNQFVRRSGSTLSLDGQPYRFAGVNCYYLMVFAADPSLRSRVDSVLEAASALGMSVVRTWAFASGDEWNALRPTAKKYDERAFRGLDYVVARAGELGLRLVLALTNYWPDYGGMEQYVRWSPHADRRDDFYTDGWCRAQFSRHIEAVTGRRNHLSGIRYCDDPTVMAWELANEPRCASDPAGTTLRDWISWAGGRLRTAAPRQLVSTGSEGFYGRRHPHSNPWRWRNGQGCDFVRDHELDVIDLASVHLYPDHWYLDRDRCLRWIDDHIEAAERIEKPIVFGEYGKRGDPVTRAAFFRPWMERFERHGATGSMAWSLYDDDYPDYDGFGIYPARGDSVRDLLARHATAMHRDRQLTPQTTRP